MPSANKPKKQLKFNTINENGRSSGAPANISVQDTIRSSRAGSFAGGTRSGVRFEDQPIFFCVDREDGFADFDADFTRAFFTQAPADVVACASHLSPRLHLLLYLAVLVGFAFRTSRFFGAVDSDAVSPSFAGLVAAAAGNATVLNNNAIALSATVILRICFLCCFRSSQESRMTYPSLIGPRQTSCHQLPKA